MKIREYVDKINFINLYELKNKLLEDIFFIFHSKNLKRLYILKDKKPIFVLTTQTIVDIFMNKKEKLNALEFFGSKDFLECFEADKHVIDAYYEMRKNNFSFMPVCENGEIIGEIDFDTLSLKISYIVIKDELTGLFNKKYFDVIVEEYEDFNKPVGIIFVEVRDLYIYEGLYGVEIGQKILKTFAEVLKNSVRKIDFIFRWDNQFRIITFNDLEITSKIFSRIQNKLNSIKIGDMHIPFKMCMSHIPQLQDNILLALENCEEQFID